MSRYEVMPVLIGLLPGMPLCIALLVAALWLQPAPASPARRLAHVGLGLLGAVVLVRAALVVLPNLLLQRADTATMALDQTMLMVGVLSLAGYLLEAIAILLLVLAVARALRRAAGA